MAITGEDLKRTLAWHTQRRLERIAAGLQSADDIEEPPEQTPEEEAILDQVWAEMAEKYATPTICTTMTDEETREFFGLNDEGE